MKITMVNGVPHATVRGVVHKIDNVIVFNDDREVVFESQNLFQKDCDNDTLVKARLNREIGFRLKDVAFFSYVKTHGQPTIGVLHLLYSEYAKALQSQEESLE